MEDFSQTLFSQFLEISSQTACHRVGTLCEFQYKENRKIPAKNIDKIYFFRVIEQCSSSFMQNGGPRNEGG